MLSALALLGWLWLLHRLATTPSDDLPSAWPAAVANLMHAVTHAVLAVLYLRTLVPLGQADAWPGPRTVVARSAIVFAAAHGIFEECTQYFVAGRSCSVGDLLLDVAGAALIFLPPWPRGLQRPLSWWPALVLLLALPLIAAGFDQLPWLDGLLASFLSSLVA